MSGDIRRKKIIEYMCAGQEPLSGTSLAESFGVSRQVIVQDVALLRAEGYDILSTNRGYILERPCTITRVFKVCHTDADIEKELNCIVDLGGIVQDVFVNHKAYGRVSAQLNIASRRDVDLFIQAIKTGKSTPLKNVTSNYHYHTVEAASKEILDEIEAALKKLGFLVPPKNI